MCKNKFIYADNFLIMGLSTFVQGQDGRSI